MSEAQRNGLHTERSREPLRVEATVEARELFLKSVCDLCCKHKGLTLLPAGYKKKSRPKPLPTRRRAIYRQPLDCAAAEENGLSIAQLKQTAKK